MLFLPPRLRLDESKLSESTIVLFMRNWAREFDRLWKMGSLDFLFLIVVLLACPAKYVSWAVWNLSSPKVFRLLVEIAHFGIVIYGKLASFLGDSSVFKIYAGEPGSVFVTRLLWCSFGSFLSNVEVLIWCFRPKFFPSLVTTFKGASRWWMLRASAPLMFLLEMLTFELFIANP